MTGAENLSSVGIRSPYRPARSKSLYRLSYVGLPSGSNECNIHLQLSLLATESVDLSPNLVCYASECGTVLWHGNGGNGLDSSGSGWGPVTGS